MSVSTKSFWALSICCIFVPCSAENVMIDCHPDSDATQDNCLKRGCIWKRSTVVGAPFCTFDTSNTTKFAGYDAKFSHPHQEAILRRRNTPTLFGQDFWKLHARFETLTSSIFCVKIGPSQIFNQAEFHPSIGPSIARLRNQKRPVQSSYKITVETEPFGFKIGKEGRNTIFDSTKLPGFTFSKQFVQLTTRVPTPNIYGFGEQYHTELRQNFSYNRLSFFTHDQPPSIPNVNSYSFHPFYLGLTEDNQSYGVFLHTTYPMDVFLQPDPNLISFRIIGGALEFYFFLGPSSDMVVQQYTDVIGRPHMPPYWSLGFHLSRFGYKNLSYLQEVWNRNRAAGIPQDVQIIDIDYMSNRMDFTYDNDGRFNGLPEFIQKEIHGTGRKFVPIVDPAIASRPKFTYSPLTDGLKLDIFVKDSRTGQSFEGKSWPGGAYWPDFTHPLAPKYWTDRLKDFHGLLGFDGIWLDMMDPSDDIDGAMDPEGCAANSLNQPPFFPVLYEPIYKNTLCLDAVQHLGYHYEWHNYYGFYESMVTNYAAHSVFPGKRPFILSRSTAPGSGRYTSHWSGDNFSAWSQLNHSIIALLEMNMFGIPFMGADICGFDQNTTEELCLRWSQLGSFYTYCRNHNSIENFDQDPAVWSAETAQAIRAVLLVRYSLLPFLYTLFYRSHATGSPVVRPMFFEYPSDPLTWNMHDQFFWGHSLLITPILSPDTTERQVYFPKGRWYNIFDRLAEVPNSDKSRFLLAKIPRDSIGLFLRGGHILPITARAEDTTEKSRKKPFQIVMVPDEAGGAHGELFWDDGESVLSIAEGKICLINFEAKVSTNGGYVKFSASESSCPDIPVLEKVTLAGAKRKPIEAKVGQRLLDESSIEFLSDEKVLSFKRLNLNLKAVDISLSWQY